MAFAGQPGQDGALVNAQGVRSIRLLGAVISLTEHPDAERIVSAHNALGWK